eukprot:1174085-Prorocentrum_minimum.AAC.1
MVGTHPHQWCPRRAIFVWAVAPGGVLTRAVRNSEVYITHNGDFEFFKLLGKLEPVDHVQWALSSRCERRAGARGPRAGRAPRGKQALGLWGAECTLAVMGTGGPVEDP